MRIYAKIKKLGGNSQGGTALRVTTYDTSVKEEPIYDSQAKHQYGYVTEIGVSSEKSVEATASATVEAIVGAEYAGVCASKAYGMGVSVSASYTVGTSISYTIPETVPDGRYRIEVIFPRKTVDFYIYSSSKYGLQVIKDVTISYMPCSDDAYHTLERYAD